MADFEVSKLGHRVLNEFMESPRTALSGADLMRRANLFSGTLYPLLKRFETAGYLKGSWEEVDPSEVGRPRRKLYRITALGQNAFNRAARERGFPVEGGVKI